MDCKRKFIFISNFTLEPSFAPFLKKEFKNESELESIFALYEEVCAWELDKFKAIDVEMAVFWLNYEILTDEVELAIKANIMKREEAVEFIVNQYSRLINNFVVRDIDIVCVSLEKGNIYPSVYLGNIIDKNNILIDLNYWLWIHLKDKVTFLDITNCIIKTGKIQTYDFLSRYRWGSLYSKEIYKVVAQEIYKHYLSINGKTKKCIVVDCDNVLWGGTLSEDGIEKVKLGKIGKGALYRDFQKVLLDLYYHGVILAVCSKNDFSDVQRMFSEHDEMVLQKKHISCFQVNWNNKADNILKISNFLNIGLDSMVFIDDSEFEIEGVRHLLPDVQCIHFDKKIEVTYKKMDCFNLKASIEKEKVEERNRTYQTNELREKLKKSTLDYNEYLKALEMQCKIDIATKVVYNRVAELSLRVNKCTNGVRYNINTLIEKMKKTNYILYVVYLRDKFSDLGLVGVMGIENNSFLDLFCLSCRALGRNIEGRMLHYVKERHKITMVRFEKTGKNQEVQNMLLELESNGNNT